MALSHWGWDDHWEHAFARVGDASLFPGRVTIQERTRWTVETAEGTRLARMRSAGGEHPAAGDWVTLHRGPTPTDPWSIEGILPRRSTFARRAAGERATEQIVAANVDRVWIVHALDVAPNRRRLERYLAVAWESGAQPEFVLTKSDIAVDIDEARRVVGELAYGAPIWVVSALEPDTLAEVTGSLRSGQTIALLGPSGVGKSSLINHLAVDEVLDTAPVRATDKKGRHTTTRRHLVRGIKGALLMDTPGMRELQVWELDRGLDQAFPEIDELAQACRFRDCTHRAEPGCAVLAAVADGSIDEARLASYRKLQAESAYQRRKIDPRARAEAVSEFKAAMKSLRFHPKYRDRSRPD